MELIQLPPPLMQQSNDISTMDLDCSISHAKTRSNESNSHTSISINMVEEESNSFVEEAENEFVNYEHKELDEYLNKIIFP